MNSKSIRPVGAFDADRILAEIVKWVEFETPSDRPDLIDALLDHVEGLFEGLPVERRRIPASEGRGGQLVLRYDPARSNSEPLLFMGHIDTVWEAGTLAARPVRRDGDKVFGPGIFDMKAGSCLATLTLLDLARAGIVPPRPVVVYLNSDEEIGSHVSRGTIETLGREAAMIMVPEPSFEAVGTVITARKGWGNFTLRATGISAHAGGSLHEGRSAIREIARHVLELEAMTENEPHATFNVGTIAGGTRPNVVPAEASAEVDMRVDNMDEAKRLEAAILARRPFDPDVKLEVTGGVNRPPFARSSEVAKLYEATRGLADRLGLPLGETQRGGVSDGNIVAALGKPVLDGLGCSGAGAHALHEHILYSTIAPRAALMFAMATDEGYSAQF
ncbi:MAG TPA: M20 family metallopeptidase [Rhizobiaceae bacterium]|nr:M20 family metallopeptidase [Rhizobiaceae bacterium]